jgi:hypothetical protein
MSILQTPRLLRFLSIDALPNRIEADRVAFINSWTRLLNHDYTAAIGIFHKIVKQYPWRSSRATMGQQDIFTGTIDVQFVAHRLLEPMAFEAEEANYGLPSIIMASEFHSRPYNIDSSEINDWYEQSSQNIDTDEIREYLSCTLSAFECTSCDRMCSENDSRFVDGGSTMICSSCCDDSYTWSDYEDRYIHNDDVREALDEDGHTVFVSDSNPDFHFDARLDQYVHEDYMSDDDEDDDDSGSVINGYHSSRSLVRLQHDVWTAKHMRFIGVELEVECGDESRSACASAVNDVVNKEGRMMFFENDGSLSHGFEMITQPMSLPAHRELFKFLTQPGLTKGMRSHATSTCGLHVHVSRSGLTPLQIQKIVAFVNSPDNEWFIRALARRYSTGYCNIKEKKIGNGIHTSFDRYEAVNLTNSKTIEFRIFRGSLKYEAVIAAIEFCHAVIEFCRPAVTSVNQLSAGSFLTFCATNMADETKILRSYVTSRLRGRAGANAEAA